MDKTYCIVIFCSLISTSLSGSPFTIECSHTFDLNLDLAQILNLNVSTNIRIINSFLSEIFVNSPCCQNISFVSEGIVCTDCSENGIKVCNVSAEAIEIKRIQDEGCESSSVINLSCTSRVCSRRNSTENIEVYRPGEDTGCLQGNKRYQCSKYGKWAETNCSSDALFTSTFPLTHVSNEEHEKGATPYTTTSYTGNISETITDMSTEENSTQSNKHGSSIGDLLTTPDTLNISDLNAIHDENTTIHRLGIPNETLAENFDTKKAMTALYTFLIVLGVVLVIVFIIVCAFFMRKQKDKLSITHVDYPLEYWHDREYIDNVVEKSYTMKSSYTVNPVYDNKGFVKSRYKKKNELDCTKRRGYASQGSIGEGNGRTRSTTFRTQSNGSASSNTDHPRKTTHDYTDKYLATATGSNFYNYNPAQTQDVIKKTTDLDLSTEDEADRPSAHTAQPGTSSFRPTGKGKKQTNKKGMGDELNDIWDEHFPNVDEENMYSVSYKEHLRRSLEDWSAEESDA